MKTARRVWIPFAVLAALFFSYVSMFLRYRPYDIDNPWFLSFSYNLWVDRVETDQFAGIAFPGGMNGTWLFGKIAAYTQGAVLAHAGWQQRPAAILSAALVVLALWLWWLQLRRLGFGRGYCAAFLVAAGMSEPLLAAANKFRYEPVSFVLISLGLMLIAQRRPLPGMLAAGLAIEVEPMAVAGLIPALVLCWYVYRVDGGSLRKTTLPMVGGLLLAASIALALHPELLHLPGLMARSGAASDGFSGGFVAAYFSRLRHLPELACFAMAAAVYWRRRERIACHYPAIAAAALVVFALLMPHGNPAYMIFVFPFLAAMALSAFDAERRPWLMAGVVLLYALPQQIVLMRLNGDQGYTRQDIEAVSQAVGQAERSLPIADGELRVYGDYRLWFAHPHRYRAALTSTAKDAREADLYLCFERAPESGLPVPLETLYCGDFKALVPLRPVGSILVRNERLSLYARE